MKIKMSRPSLLKVATLSVYVLGTGATNANAQTDKVVGQHSFNRTPTLQQFGKMPLSFEQNQGQSAKQVNFLSRGAGYSLYLTPNEAVFSLSSSSHHSPPQSGRKGTYKPSVPPSVLRMKLLGANPASKSVGEAKLQGTVNYFKGKDPKQWHTNIGTYGKVRYQSVYRGIDQVFYGNQRKLEYDFVVSPFADYKQVKMEFAGAKSVKLLANGDLKLALKGGSVTWQAPVVYQEANGKRTKVAGKYVLQGRNRVGFEVAKYDCSKPLVIDPVLQYSTFLGGDGREEGRSIAVDSAGSAYVTGTMSSSGLATAGAYDEIHNGDFDVFVAKFNATGTALVYSTYIGGGGEDQAYGIALDSDGNAYLTGTTFSTGFPTTPGAFDTTYNGLQDTFVAKLNPTGTALVYSTFLGSSGEDRARGIAIDASRNAYITGSTRSPDDGPTSNFPTTVGAYDTTFNAGIGDAFVTKLNTTGTALVYSTFLGSDGAERGNAIVLDSTGNACVAGLTSGATFPTTPGAYDTTANVYLDIFVTKLNAAGSALVFSTFRGTGLGRSLWYCA